MKDGFIKVASATPKIAVADCIFNKNSIIQLMQETSKTEAKLTVFPELCITGYTCADLFFQKTLLDGAKEALLDIVKASAKLKPVYAIGLPLMNNNKLYNCCAVVYRGYILGIVPKSNIPGYAEFCENRYFSPAPDENSTIELFGKKFPFGSKLIFKCTSMPNFKIGVEICEDLWYLDTPSCSHVKNGATIIANLSASDEISGKSKVRRNLISSHSSRLLCGYIYSNVGDGESTTDIVFSGHNIICERGNILEESCLFENKVIYSDIDVDTIVSERMKINSFSNSYDNEYAEIEFDMKPESTILSRKYDKNPFVTGSEKDIEQKCEEIISIQANGLKKRIEHTNCKKLVIGISGGLDSCLALLVCAKTMQMLNRPIKDILCITMPCFGTTSRTKNNAEKLCEYLGAEFKTIDIKNSVNCHFEDIEHDKNKFDIVYENSQARERTQVLMDIANGVGGMVIGTGDLSELALGWATYNGDHMSMYAVNSSVPKTLIRYIVRYVADKSEENIKNVLYDILDTPVSPELLPANNDNISQKTEDLVGPYELHDFFLYYVIRHGYSPSKIFRICTHTLGDIYDRETILYWLKNFYRRFFAQQFKRSCLPDGPKVGSVNLSPRGDWKMPSDAVWNLWKKEIENIE